MVSTKNSMFIFWLYRCRATFWEAGLSIIVPVFWENYRTIGLVTETYRTIGPDPITKKLLATKFCYDYTLYH